MQLIGQIGWASWLHKYTCEFLIVLTFFSILASGETVALVHMFNGSNDVCPCKDVSFGGFSSSFGGGEVVLRRTRPQMGP